MATTSTSLRDSIFVIWLLTAAPPALADNAQADRQDSGVLSPVATTWPARGSAPHAGRFALGLLLIDRQGLSQDVRRSVGSHIERLLESSGVDVRTVVSLNPTIASPDFPVVEVRLWPRDGSVLQADRSAMGIVRVDRGQVESVHVFYPVIVSTLLDGDESIEDLSSREIGRAVGRVIAHELVHAIAPGLPHARFGLMQPVMDKAFLRGLRPTPIDGRSAKVFQRQVEARFQTAARLDSVAAVR
jgi:hypothetical protein